MSETVKKRERNWRLVAAVTSSAGLAAITGCGGQHQQTETVTVTTGGNVPTVPVNTHGPDVLLKGSEHQEIVQFSIGSHTFGDYRHFSNEGPDLPQGAVVQVDCLVTDKQEANDSTRGKWYHLIGPEAVRGLYAPSNTFENGIDDPNRGPAADPKVPDCPAP